MHAGLNTAEGHPGISAILNSIDVGKHSTFFVHDVLHILANQQVPYILTSALLSFRFPFVSHKSTIDVGGSDLAHSQRSTSSQRCWMGLMSGLRAHQSSSSTPNWEKHFFVELALCHVEAEKKQTQYNFHRMLEH